MAEQWRFVEPRNLVPEAVVSAVGYRSELPEPVAHLGLPSPAVTFVLTFDEPVVSGFCERGTDARSASIVLGGLHTRPAHLLQPRVQTGIQLAVRPLAVRALLGAPAAELREQAFDAREVLGPRIELLRERLAELPTWSQRFTALAEHLRSRTAEQPASPRPEVAEAWRWIAWHRGNGSMSELARHVHLGERQLNALFKAEVGLAPKALSRLMRFEHARRRIALAVRGGARPDLSSVAHACGYFDHSHLVRDFRQYAGTTPTTWIERELRNVQAAGAWANADLAV
ncbi:AraC family transcriptional regulator [Saccharopolyspora griseoalba]|uniref:Helix-turn-helix domain-containing protein n=1 Tax=Saccharopolyspora griseoalba TaxID=1431848 RepID=A0ABW2LDJ9_9PSEU